MLNIRQVSVIEKEGGAYTLVSVKVVVEDSVNHKTLNITKEVGENFLNVTALFSAIQNETVAAVTSSLIS